MEKELIYIAWHKEERDNNNKLITPACIFKFYKSNGETCFGDKYIATCEQIYAHRNKKIDSSRLSINDFKGAGGIQEYFYTEGEIKDYLEMLTNEGYSTRRMTKHKTNSLADNLFEYFYNLQIRKASFVLPK